MVNFPAMRIHFDDGDVVEVRPRLRDMALAERDFHHDYTESGNLTGMYVTALAALGRMKRAGEIDRDLPDTPDGLIEIADLEVVEDPDPEGKGSDPAPTTG